MDNRYGSVQEIRDKWLCHGCGMCAAICRKDAVRIEYQEKYRTYVPIVDDSLCTLCGACVKSCSGHGTDFRPLSKEYLQGTAENLYTGDHRKCYLGWSTNIDLRFRSSSGGIATALAQHVLGHNIVDRVLVVLPSSEQNPLDFRGCLISTEEETEKAMGSKYCPVTMCGSLRNVDKSEKIAVIGLPCHIQSIRKAQKNLDAFSTNPPLLIGLFCSTQMGRNGTQWFVNKHGRELKTLRHITYRGYGWPGNLKASFTDGSEIMEPMKEYKDAKFHAYTPWRCKVCSDALSELADISLGDAWLPEITSCDRLGASMIITRSVKGEDVLLSAVESGEIHVQPSSIEDVMRSQQGLLINKKKNIHGSMLMAGMLRRARPEYDNIEIENNHREMLGSFLYRLKKELIWLVARRFINTRTLPMARCLLRLRQRYNSSNLSIT